MTNARTASRWIPSFTFAILIAVASPMLGSDNEFDEVRSILQAKSKAWEQGDAEAWGKNYSEDSALINIFGTRFPDRETNIKRHAEVFEGALRDTSLKVEIEQIELLAENIVLAETILTVTGYDSLPEGAPETTAGVLQTRMSFLLRDSEENGWQIVFAQNTAIVSP